MYVTPNDQYGNIALSGSTTVFTGVGENRDTHGTRTIDQKIKVVAAPERKHSAWIGASILSPASTLHRIWIPKSRTTSQAT